MALRVLALADEISAQLYDYFQPERWKGIDLVLSAGDLPPGYLDFLCTNLNVPVFYVRGNHDGGYRRIEYDGCENLHGRIVSYKGVRIAGFEGCMGPPGGTGRRFNDAPMQYSEAQMRWLARWAQLQALHRGAPHIVLTHAPIARFHDGTDFCHRGFECFRSLLHAWRPRYFVHGHTHLHYSRECVSHLGSTTVINAFPYRVFEVEPEPAPQPTWQSIGARSAPR